jgi:uncharacterized protein
MSEKIGRNDPCPCGSGKKYKQCCLLHKKQKVTTLAGRKFTAKVISKPSKSPEEKENEEQQLKAEKDYNSLMERSFGAALHSNEESPTPADPSEFIEK